MDEDGAGHPRELHLSRVWAEGRLPGDLRLVDGRRLQIIYSGVWTNSNGPDFRDAMIAVDGEFLQGSVEIHIRASDWYRHGHEKNPAYDEVILHVVLTSDTPTPIQAGDGSPIPTFEAGAYIDEGSSALEPNEERIIAALGSRTCLPTLGSANPDLVRRTLRQQGWRRLTDKQRRFSQDLAVLTASETLYRGLLDALGYSNNRVGMSQLGERVPLQLLEGPGTEYSSHSLLGVLLGAAGFLGRPETLPGAIANDLDLSELTGDWHSFRRAYRIEPLPLSVWTLNRVRPTNHPAVRLASLASLLNGADGRPTLERFLDLDLDGGRSWDRWLATAQPTIGAGRRAQILTNIFAPFLAAYAEVMRDDALAQDVARLWEQLRGSVRDRVARSTRIQILGEARFPIRLALEEQGLHDIYRNGCSELRCFDCPIAKLAVEHEPWSAYQAQIDL